jgi:hypothetical protein
VQEADPEQLLVGTVTGQEKVVAVDEEVVWQL